MCQYLHSNDINARINNIKAQQKAFKVDKTYFNPERTFNRQAYFTKQNSKNWERFPKSPGNQYMGTKTNIPNSHTRKKGPRGESKYKET